MEDKEKSTATVYRVKRNKNYTTMANYHFRDRRLSLKAKGLLSLILSLPEDWEYTVQGFTSLGPDGRDAIRAALKELEGAGYITRAQTHGERGKFAGNEYIVWECPKAPPLTDFPSTANPSAGFPLTENPPQLNTNQINIPPYSPPKGGRKKVHKDIPDHDPQNFLKLWKWYPHDKRGNKQRAIRAWDALKPEPPLVHTIAVALAAQAETDDWQRGVGIPHLSTYLNQYGWESMEENE